MDLNELFDLEDWEYVVEKTSLDPVWYATIKDTPNNKLGVYCVSRDDLSFVIVGDSEEDVINQVAVANDIAVGPGVTDIAVATSTWMSLCSRWRGVLYKGKVRQVISGLDWIPSSVLMSPDGIIAPDPFMILCYMEVAGKPLVDLKDNIIVGGHPADVINELHDIGYAGEVFDDGEFKLMSLMDLSLHHKHINYRGEVYNTRAVLARNPKFVKDMFGDKEEELIQLLNLKRGVDNEN